MKKYTFILIILLSVGLFFTSCQSVPKDIPENLTAAELIQLAQNSYENGKIKAAQTYYETVIIRYGSDMKLLVEAEFELAHIDVKKERWSQAIPALQRILHYYETDTTGQLPQEYKKLAEIDLAKAPEFELKKLQAEQEAAEVIY